MCVCVCVCVFVFSNTFNIKLNNHRKNVNNPKSIPVDFHFRKPGHSFNLYANLTLIEQLNNIHTTQGNLKIPTIRP